MYGRITRNLEEYRKTIPVELSDFMVLFDDLDDDCIDWCLVLELAIGRVFGTIWLNLGKYHVVLHITHSII